MSRRRLSFVPLVFLLGVVGCDDGSKDASSEPAAEKKTDDTAEAKTDTKAGAKSDAKAEVAESPLPGNPTPPCDSVSAAFVGETFGWSDVVEGQPASMSKGRVQGCTFNRRGSEGGTLAIMVSHIDARGVANKYVERAFATDLSNKNPDKTFAEVTPKLGDQTVFGHGKQGPHIAYQLRWRTGNQVDSNLTVRFPAEQDPADIQAKLRTIAAKL